MNARLEQLRAWLAPRIRAYEASGEAYRIDHTVQVTSFGGSGTTALCRHLLAHGVDLQTGPGQWPFKHRRHPPAASEVPSRFRVVYIVSDPRDAVLSIFRRGYQVGHFGALHGHSPDADAERRLASLDDFLAAGIDDFALVDHVDRWRNHDPAYPVLFLRYDRLSDAWPTLADFVGLPPDAPRLPVRPRGSDWRELAPELRDRLDAMYGELARRIESMPAVDIA